jgi:hypothetical protein
MNKLTSENAGSATRWKRNLFSPKIHPLLNTNWNNISFSTSATSRIYYDLSQIAQHETRRNLGSAKKSLQLRSFKNVG